MTPTHRPKYLASTHPTSQPHVPIHNQLTGSALERTCHGPHVHLHTHRCSWWSLELTRCAHLHSTCTVLCSARCFGPVPLAVCLCMVRMPVTVCPGPTTAFPTGTPFGAGDWVRRVGICVGATCTRASSKMHPCWQAYRQLDALVGNYSTREDLVTHLQAGSVLVGRWW